MTATLPFLLLFVYLVFGEPLVGRWSYRRFVRHVRERPAIRARYYLMVIVTVWLLVALLAWGAHLAGLSLRDLGIGPVQPAGMIGFGGSFSGTFGIAVLIGGLIGCILPAVLVRVNPRYRELVRGALARIDDLLPSTRGQMLLWVALSLSAGIGEELLYRSFLFWYLGRTGPFTDVGLLLLVTGIVFGLAHTYQGIRGVLGTTALGFAFGLLYVLTASVLPAMVLHTAIDLRVLTLLSARQPSTAEVATT